MKTGSQILGVNLDGLEFGSPTSSNPGVAGTNYFVPTVKDIDALAADGASTIRVPFSWERLQPTLGGALDTTYLGYLQQIVSEAQAKGLNVILDCHNYGGYDGNLIGSANGPTNANFANLWGHIATAFAGDSNVEFGLMNEPQQSSATGWLATVNAAIGAIAQAQTAAGQKAGSQEVLISGLNWDGAASFASSAFAQLVQQNLNSSQAFYAYGNVAFEVHQYFDPYGSGTDTTTPLTNPLAGITDLLADTNWGLQTGLKLYLGETAVPRDAASQSVLSNLMESMAANPTVWQGLAYWAASPYWSSSYGFNIDPSTVPNAPQMATMENTLRAIDAAAWISGSNVSTSVSNSLIYSVANATKVSLKGSDDTLFLNSGFSGALTGNDDVVNALGDDEIIASTMTGSGTVTVFGSLDAITANGPGVGVTLMGAGDTAITNGANDVATLTGGGSLAAAEVATLAGAGDTAILSGAYDSVTLQGAGTKTVYESATAAGAYDAVNVAGAYDRVTLSGVNAGETATLTGANGTATLSGAHNTVSLDGASETANLTAASDVANLNGSAGSAILTGAGDAAALAGSSNSATLNGAGESATVAGNSDLITLNGSYNSATMNGVGTSAVHDTVVVAGANDTVNLKGAYNFASLNGVETAATSETAGVTGADDSITVGGAYDFALLAGIGSGGMYELATLTGADDSVTTAGNFDWATLQGANDAVNQVAAHGLATLTGRGDSLTMAGCYNSAVLHGTNETATLTGFRQTLTLGGGTATVSAAGANETFVFSAGFGQVSLTGLASHETGSTHDVLSLASSEFTNFATVLADAHTAAGNAVIAGSHGDALTLIGVTTSALAGLAADFSFHS